MRAKTPLPAALCLLLMTGCGNPRNDAAVSACSAEIADKLEGKTFVLDRDDMSRHARDESPDVVHVSSTVVFDKGLSTEYQQTFDCRVRLEKDKPASVIGLQFNWSKEDLKKANAED